MTEDPSSLTIRFSCTCGAEFEVPSNQAGRLGRCGRCGKEMVIPETSELVEPSPALVQTQAPQQSPQHPQRGRFCPFCGQAVQENARLCPSCLKNLTPEKSIKIDQSRLTTIDWVLSTLFAPLGCVGGFIFLVMGTRKGLDMMGISTVSIFVWWCMAILLGWIR